MWLSEHPWLQEITPFMFVTRSLCTMHWARLRKKFCSKMSYCRLQETIIKNTSLFVLSCVDCVCDANIVKRVPLQNCSQISVMSFENDTWHFQLFPLIGKIWNNCWFAGFNKSLYLCPILMVFFNCIYIHHRWAIQIHSPKSRTELTMWQCYITLWGKEYIYKRNNYNNNNNNNKIKVKKAKKKMCFRMAVY